MPSREESNQKGGKPLIGKDFLEKSCPEMAEINGIPGNTKFYVNNWGAAPCFPLGFEGVLHRYIIDAFDGLVGCREAF